MVRRALLAALPLFAIGATAAPPLPPVPQIRAEAQRRPNVIFILIDDMGWQDVGFMGSRYYRTPNIDALARRGVVFTDAYANAPNCTPTRAAIMSGQYGPRTGIYTVDFPNDGPKRAQRLMPVVSKFILPQGVATMAEMFNAAGYATAHIGKWHLGYGPQTGPRGQGFDVNIGGSLRGAPGKGGYFGPYETPEWATPGQDMPGLMMAPEGEYLTDRLTDEATRFIDTNRDRPFFLHLAHYTVHNPLEAPAGSDAPWTRVPANERQGHPVYAAMVKNLDDNIGRLVRHLEARRLLDDTIIVFTSDNGGHAGSTWMPALRGDKGQLYEGGIRVPTFVVAPGGARDKRVGTPILSIDWYPTLAALARVPVPTGARLDGRSVARAITTGAALSPVPLYWHMPTYLQWGRPFDGAGIAPPADGIFRNRPRGAIRDGDWKLIQNFEDRSIELYNLQRDPRERSDLSKAEPRVARRLLTALRRWQSSTRAPIPTVANPEYDPTYRPPVRERAADPD